MKHLIQISILIIAVQCCGEVKCKHIYKNFHFGLVPLPKHFSFSLEKLTPFGTYEFKHTIKKRQVLHTQSPSPVINEVLPIDDPLKVPMTHLLEKTEVNNAEKLPAEVLITSVVEPLEPGKPISFLLPVDSEVVITPAVKDVVAPIPLTVDVPVGIQPETKPEVGAILPNSIVNITPEPLPILLPEELKPVEPNEVVVTPVENINPAVPLAPVGQSIPPVEFVPALQNLNTPVISPVINSIPIAPFLYTNIKGIPFYTPAANVIPFITQGAVPIPEAIIPPSPPPVIKEILPIVKEEVPIVVKEEIPPVVKEDPRPNFFVKSSRFVLYFGSMMLQMLSRFVNGQATPNQIPLPPFPGIQ